MKRFSLICMFAFFALVRPASATLLTLTQFMGLLPTPPASLLPSKLFSQQYVFLFLEQQHVTLAAPLGVDITMPGTYTMRTQLIPGQIAAGTVVNSYYLHANPINTKMAFTSQAVSFSNDEIVIGVMVASPTLAAAVPVVGDAQTTYNGAAAGNGLKLATAGTDSITISSDQHTVTFTETLKPKEITEFRIITTTVPMVNP